MQTKEIKGKKETGLYLETVFFEAIAKHISEKGECLVDEKSKKVFKLGGTTISMQKTHMVLRDKKMNLEVTATGNGFTYKKGSKRKNVTLFRQ